MADSNGSGNGNVGTVEQVQGVVIDVAFAERLPEINHALKIEIPEGEGRREMDLVLEVQQHLGDDRVRTVAMDAADGLRRGDEVVDTGGPITVPVGKADAGADLQPARRADRPRRPRRGRRALADPPPGAGGRGPDARPRRSSRPGSR